MRKELKHNFRFGDTVSLFEIIDNSSSDVYKGSFKIKDYSHLGYKCYKEGDEKFQDEIGFIINANNLNPNEITIWFGENKFITVPYFCLNLEEKTSKQLARDNELFSELEEALLLYEIAD